MAERTITQVIESATRQALRKMVTEGDELGTWKPDALATWLTPTIIRAVQRFLAKPPPRKRSKRNA